MSDQFFEKPILNSPYDYPRRHWVLDEEASRRRYNDLPDLPPDHELESKPF
jgi:hypothetical protein